MILLGTVGLLACGPNYTGNDDDGGGSNNTGLDASVSQDASGNGGSDAWVYPDSGTSSDAGSAYQLDGAAPTDACPTEMMELCPNPVDPGCGPTETCNNGLDDNCDGQIDENCSCAPGAVQQCFLGPPGRASTGACTMGTQTCLGNTEFGFWGPCENGIWPSMEICDGLDNDCNGCDDDHLCCAPPINCPAPGDIVDAQPFQSYQLDGTQWYTGTATSWSWTVEGGPCDSVLGDQFTISGADTATPVLEFTLSGDYTVTMTVVTPTGTYTCTFILHVVGPGVRVELCWEGTGSRDIDLHLLRDDLNTDWCDSSVDCYYMNCKGYQSNNPDWGYATTAVSNCEGGPNGSDWLSKGYCSNPRLDVDNISTPGQPENINVDNPNDGDTFRVMVHYYSGSGEAYPLINIYCDGHRTATYGQAPNQVTGFNNSGGYNCQGHSWRVADVTTSVVGGVTTCTVTALHPPGQTSGFHIRTDDNQYD